jgi:hypothetical protein
MIEDLFGSLKAIALFPAFLFFPGYAVSWLLDLFDFRRRTLAFRATLAIPASIAFCPILTFALARFAGFPAVWAFYALAALLFCFCAIRSSCRAIRLTLRYHYCWLLMCSLVNQTAGSGTSARQAIIGGTFWMGVRWLRCWPSFFASSTPAYRHGCTRESG